MSGSGSGSSSRNNGLNGLKLRGNGLFESSRMMLPEHKEAYLRHQQRLDRQEPPELDSQKLDDMNAALAESLASGSYVVLVLFGEYDNEELNGIVTQADAARGRIRLEGPDYVSRWVALSRIIDVRPGRGGKQGQ